MNPAIVGERTATAPVVLSVKSLSKSYGDFMALQEISFQVRKGEFVCVLGASGCGKSTLVNCLAGLETFDGELDVHDEHGKPALAAVVFQEYALFPWLTVAENVKFGLRHRARMRARHCDNRVQETLELVGLNDFADAYPSALSGGMKQRVAIARCLVLKPDLILMDEPFGALDALTRDRMQGELLEIWSASSATILLVTHSISEAVRLADRVILISKTEHREVGIAAARPRTMDDPAVGNYEAEIHKWIFGQQE